MGKKNKKKKLPKNAILFPEKKNLMIWREGFSYYRNTCYALEKIILGTIIDDEEFLKDKSMCKIAIRDLEDLIYEAECEMVVKVVYNDEGIFILPIEHDDTPPDAG